MRSAIGRQQKTRSQAERTKGFARALKCPPPHYNCVCLRIKNVHRMAHLGISRVVKCSHVNGYENGMKFYDCLSSKCWYVPVFARCEQLARVCNRMCTNAFSHKLCLFLSLAVFRLSIWQLLRWFVLLPIYNWLLCAAILTTLAITTKLGAHTHTHAVWIRTVESTGS